MRTLAGLLCYLGVLAVLFVGAACGAVLLLSPTGTSPTKVAAYGAPTRVNQPATVHAESPAAKTPAVETRTFRIGPEIVHRAPEPSSQAEVAKLRLKATDRELHRGRVTERRDAPKVATRDEHTTAPAPADTRHTSNF